MRALLAFQAAEKDENGSFTEDAELGAELTLEAQNALVNLDRNVEAFLAGLAGRKKKPHGG